MLNAGMSGVDLFFVLSGYLIYSSIIRTKIKIYDYTKKRLRRIYPVFLVVLAIYICLSLAIPARSKLTGNAEQDIHLILSNLLLLPLLPFINGTRPIINATWSLAYEVFFYAAAPILVYLLQLRRASNQIRLITLSLLSILGFCAFNLLGGNDRAMMFLSGALLSEMVLFAPNFRLPQWTGAIALASGATIVGLRSEGGDFPTISLFILFNIACLDAFNPDSAFSKLLSIKPLRWMGNISYSFYLIHGLLLQGFLAATSKISIGTAFYIPFIPALIFCLAGSLVVYLFVEKPFSLTPNPSQNKITKPNTRGGAA